MIEVVHEEGARVDRCQGEGLADTPGDDPRADHSDHGTAGRLGGVAELLRGQRG